MRWDETMTAGPPGKRSSMERQQTVDCTAICGTNKQTNESSPDGCRHHHWKQHTRQTAKTHSSRDVEMPPFWILVDYWQRCVTVVSQLKITSLCSEGGPPHWSTISELVLPRFNQIGGLTEVLDLVAFTVRHSTCPRVMAAAASLTAVASVPKAVVDQCFRPGVLIGNAPWFFLCGRSCFLRPPWLCVSAQKSCATPSVPQHR